MLMRNSPAPRHCRSLPIWVVWVLYCTLQGSDAASTCDTTPCIFFVSADKIRYVNVFNASDKGDVVSDLNNARALALHVLEHLVFWSEYDEAGREQSKIRRLNLTTMRTQDVITGVGEVEDIAVEWETGLIYWTDYLFERIEVAGINGSHRKTLIWEDVLNPRAITVDPRTGFLFWTEWGWDHPKVERATLAGTERKILVDLSFSNLEPNGLVIDYQSSLLYWIDAWLDDIKYVNFNGSYSRTVERFTSLNTRPFSLALYDRMLYFSDLYSRSIERFNLTTGEHERNMGWMGTSPIYGIALLDSSTEPQGMTACKLNTDCSQLCLLTPAGAQCACSNGYELSADNVSCTAVEDPLGPPLQAIDIRLVNGSTPSELEGRVEIRLQGSNEWGTICNDHFDLRDAKVVCRMLNYQGAVKVLSARYYYGLIQDEDAVDIFLDNLKCRGDENSLMECRHRGWGVHNCNHNEDVGVVCTNESVPTPTPNATSPSIGPPPNVTVRLRGGPTWNQGRVEIYHDGKWGTICDNDFDIVDADVICRMLGHTGAWSTYCCGWFGYGSGEIWLDSVQCSGDETSIAHCSHGGWGNHQDVCTHYNDAGVYCIPNPSSRPENIVRLEEGTSPSEGRVEIFHDDQWGTICDDRWDLRDATVICRMLNYSGALAAPLFSAYNAGSGKIWLDNLDCIGNESSIEDCHHGGWENHDCSHNEDAAVICRTNDSALPVYDTKNSLVFAELQRGIIFQVDLDASHARAAPLPIDSLRRPTAIGFDPIDKMIYYAESSPGIIRRSYMNGSHAQTIINGVYYANRLAIDYIGRNIYFTDSSRYRIDVAALDGAHRTALISTVWPEGLVLDLKNGHIYWSSNGVPPRIERADMDGRNLRIIANLSIDSHPSGITLDSNGSRLYWTERNFGSVSYFDLKTGHQGEFISEGLYRPLDVITHRDKLFLSDMGTGNVWDGGIYSASLQGSGNVSKVIDLIKNAWGLDVYDKDSVITSGLNRCLHDEKNCSHLCLMSPAGSHCACPDDMELVNQTTCEYRKPLILYADCFYGEIYKAPLGWDDLFQVANAIRLEHISCPHAIATVERDNRIYWTDLIRKHIARANLDGTKEEVVVQHVNYSMGLAVDSYAENIYFTDRVKKTVEVAKHDGRFRKVLIELVTHSPVGLAIDPIRGYMYYSAWGQPPMIERAQLDGSSRKTLVTFPAWSEEGPSALTVDPDENVLYWVGGVDAVLQFIDLRYPQSEVVQQISFSHYLHQPFGLALDAHYFYWSDGLLGNVIRAGRNPDREVHALIKYQFSPRGVSIFNPEEEQALHPCVNECSHLCLLKPGGYQCACPDDSGVLCNASTHVTNAYGCQEDPSLYFIDRHEIACIDLKKSNHSFVSKKTVKTNIVEGAAIDLDHREQMIYWSDTRLWTINRMSLISGEAEVILRDLGEVEALAVEWESGLLYWTDYIYETIEVAKLDGRYRKTLLNSSLYNPRGIAVDPKKGFMFWTVWGLGDPKIERADLSGENRIRLTSFIDDWSFHLLAVSVLIDYHEERIYWIDGFTDSVDSMDYNGMNRRNVHFISENIYPTDLALFADKLYWVDWASRSIHWINKTNPGSYHSFGHLSQERLESAVVSDKSRQPVASPANRPPCRIENGGCSQLCLLSPRKGKKCECANGAYLESDGVTCSKVTEPSPKPPLPDVVVRLAGSNNSNEGRVEVGLLVNETRIWGTICDDHWGFREADVVCIMLNYSGALYVARNAYFGQQDIDTPILMDNVKCRGDEENIAGCRHNGWFNHDCRHSEDAGVVCRTGSAPEPEVPTLAPGPHPELQVRLRNGPSSNQGRVEIFLNGTWGTICDDYWGIEEANVICRMLNYTEGAWTTQCCGWYYPNNAPDQIWLDNVHCVGDEESIAECRHGGWGSHNCLHSEDVGVVCKYTPVSTPDQTLRLADGLRKGEGRVEIFHAGHWGTVCDDFWDIKDAQVVCSELGYSRALGAPRRAFFGEGNGHIWLDNVHCNGSEMSIRMCPHRGWNNENCRHYEDASVICNNGSVNVDTDDYLLTCESGRSLCSVIPLVQGSLGQDIRLMFRPQDPQGVKYDPTESRVYWTSGFGTVARAFLNGSSSETVIKDLRNPMGIGIDYAGRNIYVADHLGGRIVAARLDGSYQSTLLNYPSPQGIALDSSKGYLYFSSFGLIAQILRVDMDGQNLTILANLSSSGEASVIDVVLDKRQNRLYFADSDIKFIDLDSLRVHSFRFGNTHAPVGLTQLNNSLYWTSWRTGSFTGAIFKAELTNGSNVQMVADGFSSPNGIFAHDSKDFEAPVGCQSNGACSQICVPTPRGDRCLCQLGMRLHENGKDCVLNDVLFVADRYYNAIYMAPLKKASKTALVALPFENTENPVGVAFDPFESRVYWTDNARGVVVRSDLTGKEEEVIRANVAGVMGIALDLVGRNAYWINNINHTIEVAKLNGHHVKVLVTDLHSSSVDIALDTTRGFMYWSAYGVIEGAELDGSNRRVVALLVRWSSFFDAQSLVVDVPQNRLYFVSKTNDGMFYVDLNAGDGYVHRLFVNFYYIRSPFGIAIDDEYVYWNDFWREAVFRRKKSYFSLIETVVLGFFDPRGMFLHKGNATRNTEHPCFQSNGGCSQLCLLKARGGYTCACSSHPDPKNPCNETTVSPPLTPYPTRATSPTLPPSMEAQGCSSPPCIYFADQTSIRAINHALVNTTKVESSVVVSNLLDARALDVHVQESMIYWSDIGLQAIRRVNLTSRKIEDLITENLGRVEALAVEWESRLLYWTDSSLGRIEVARLDGRFRKTLIYKYLDSPRAIAVDPREGQGYVYFSDMDISVPRIERAHLDGTNRETIVAYWFYIPLMNSITIDFAESRLIWLDTQDNSIMSAYLNGSGEVIHRLFYQNMAPDDVDLLGDTVFFSDVHSHSIERINKSTAQHLLNFGWLSNNEVYGLAVFDSSRQPQGMKSCRQSNGGCSHLCLLKPSGRTCVCPNGMVANENGTNCTSLTVTPTPRPPVQAVEIRLMGGNRSNEGRIEIRKPDGSWGTICTDLWDIKDARVACHMLRFKDALAAVTDGKFGRGYGPVWMNNVECSGNEASLAECLSDAWRDVIFSCTSQRHAGVICRNESTNETLPQPTLPSGPLPDVKVRLQGGPTFNQGRVEVLYNNEWRGICDQSWDINDAEVVCKMLNFTGAWSTQCCGWYRGGTGKYWLNHVGCLGDEDTIAHCRHAGWGAHGCVSGSDVGVLCKYAPSQQDGHRIRLADGIQEGEGRVEIFFNGHWGTVCDDLWDIKDADVICRMLNYSGAISAVTFAGYGPGNGHIWLDNVRCNGTETSVEDCEHQGIGNHDCSHREDAGVVCITDRMPNYGAKHFMMYTDAVRSLILHRDLAIPHAQPAYLPVNKAIFPGYLSYDQDNKIVYWSEALSRGIFRSHVNGSLYETVKRSMKSPAGLAVEKFTQTLYYTDTKNGVIEVCKLDGSSSKVILYHSSPVDISLDVSNGLLYYITNNPPQIGRVEMNGANPTILANLSSGSDPKGIDFDVARQRLVWSERGIKRIGYIELAGNQSLPQTLIAGDQAPIQSLAGIALDNTSLYWIDVGTGKWSGGVFKTDHQTASLVTKVDDHLRKPVDIFIYDSSVEAAPVSRDCQTNNGGCSHLCLLHSNGVQCACPSGKHLDDARTNCLNDDILLYADSRDSQIYITSLMATDPISSRQGLQVPTVDEPLAVTVDQLEARFYWTDANGFHIVRANLDGSSEEVIMEDPDRQSRFNGIAVDVVSRTLYWTSHNTLSSEGSIHVSRLDGSYKKTLFTIHEDLEPFDIVLDPFRGYMYWATESVWLHPHEITRADMDGANRRPIIQLSSFYYWWGGLYGLALDVENNVLYWVGYHDAVIQYVNLSISGQGILNDHIQELFSSSIHLWSPYGLTLYKDHLYWTDNYADIVARVNSSNGLHFELMAEGLSNPRGIDVFHTVTQVPHPCNQNNGGCTHLCLIVPDAYKCACPDLAHNCLTTPYITPSASTFVITSAFTTSSSYSSSASSTPVSTPSSTPASSSSVASTTITTSSSHGSSASSTPVSTPSSSPASSSSVAPTTTTTSKVTDYCNMYNPCGGNGNCSLTETGYYCTCTARFFGDNCTEDISPYVVVIVIDIPLQEFNVLVFLESVANILNQGCMEDAQLCSTNGERARRETQTGPFKPEDIRITSGPNLVDGKVQVEYAVVRTTPEGKNIPVPSQELEEITEERKADLGDKLGGEVLSVKAKPPPVTGTQIPPTASETAGGKQDSGLIIGVIVAVAIILICVGLAVWYFRFRKQSVPYILDKEETGTRIRGSAFENPGYDSMGAMDASGEVSVDHFTPVNLLPFEHDKDFSAASNPLYEIGMVRLDHGQKDGFEKGTSNEYATIDRSPSSELKQPSANEAEEVPIKVTLGEETCTGHVEITVEPQNESLVSSKIDKPDSRTDEVEVTVLQEVEPRYVSLDELPSAYCSTGQTVVVTNDITAETES